MAGFPRVGFSFAAGVGVHALRRSGVRVPQVHPIAPVILLALILVTPDVGARLPFQLGSIVIAFPIIVLLGSASGVDPKQAAAFDVLGTVSYPIYALHWPLYQIVDRGTDRSFGVDLSRHAPLSGAAFLVMVTAVAWAAERMLDRPMRKALSAAVLRWNGHRRSTAREPR